jgi:hypothetical protein
LEAGNSSGASKGLSDEHRNLLDKCRKLPDEYWKLGWSSVHLIGSGMTVCVNP